MWEATTQRCEYQEVRIIGGHCGGCLLQHVACIISFNHDNRVGNNIFSYSEEESLFNIKELIAELGFEPSCPLDMSELYGEQG